MIYTMQQPILSADSFNKSYQYPMYLLIVLIADGISIGFSMKYFRLHRCTLVVHWCSIQRESRCLCQFLTLLWVCAYIIKLPTWCDLHNYTLYKMCHIHGF
uniref:Uncharacterized protein n=1 Tax=Cacopsylla melanoneura TaxID=428564 RepID=A0A8D8R957_9HEMI